MSAADKEAWRRWAKARKDQDREGRRRKRKGSSRGRPLSPAARVPTFKARDHGGAPVPVHRPRCSAFQLLAETGTLSAHCAGLWRINSQVQLSNRLLTYPVVVRQGSGPDAQITVEVAQLQFLAKVVFVVVQRQVLWSKQYIALFGSSQLQSLDKVIGVPVVFNDTCPWRSRHSSSTWLLSCPLCNDTVMAQTVRKLFFRRAVHRLGCCCAHCATTVEQIVASRH